MVETHKIKRKITLTISNAEHIKQTLNTNKPYRHQQHLPKKFLKTSLELYGQRRAFKQAALARESVRGKVPGTCSVVPKQKVVRWS